MLPRFFLLLPLLPLLLAPSCLPGATRFPAACPPPPAPPPAPPPSSSCCDVAGEADADDDAAAADDDAADPPWLPLPPLPGWKKELMVERSGVAYVWSAMPSVCARGPRALWARSFT